MRDLDPRQLEAFANRMVGDMGACMSGALVLLGDRLGLFKAMADGEPVTAPALATTHRPHRTLCARMGGRDGGGALYRLRPRRHHLRPRPRTGDGLRRRGRPRVHGGRVRADPVDVDRCAPHRASLPHRRGRGLARTCALPVPRHRALLPPGLRRAPDPVLDPRARTACAIASRAAARWRTSVAATARPRS